MKQLFFLVGLFVSFSISSQPVLNSLTPVDTLSFPKRPWQAAGQIVGINLGVWAIDRYIIQGDYAYINSKSIQRNFKEGFHWDNDNFKTNLFNHPYHGSLYFNSARSNGMNFWQSGLFTTGGSLMWEMLMECELPSTNDLVCTTFGGISFGETLFRVSDKVLDNRATGANRFGREFLGLVLAPGRGLTRIITGDAWKRQAYSGQQFQNSHLGIELAVGPRALELRNLNEESFDEGLGASVDIDIEYGNLLEGETEKPYDYFYWHTGFNFQKNQPLVGQFNLMGRLWGKTLYESKQNDLYLGAFQYFDYYNSDTLANASHVTGTKTPYVIGSPASLGLGGIYQGRYFQDKIRLDAQLHVGCILLGSSLSDYSRGEERNYNWGSGYGIKVKCGLTFLSKFRFDFNNEVYHLFTWNGYDPGMDINDAPGKDIRTVNYQGERSNAIYDVMTSKLAYKINKKWSLSYLRYDFFRTTNYVYYPDFTSTTSDSRIMAAFRF